MNSTDNFLRVHSSHHCILLDKPSAVLWTDWTEELAREPRKQNTKPAASTLLLGNWNRSTLLWGARTSAPPSHPLRSAPAELPRGECGARPSVRKPRDCDAEEGRVSLSKAAKTQWSKLSELNFLCLTKGRGGENWPGNKHTQGLHGVYFSFPPIKLHFQREAGCKGYWTQVWLLPAQKPIIEGQVSVERKGALFRKVSNPERSWTLVQGPTLKIMLSQDTFKWKKGKQS